MFTSCIISEYKALWRDNNYHYAHIPLISLCINHHPLILLYSKKSNCMYIWLIKWLFPFMVARCCSGIVIFSVMIFELNIFPFCLYIIYIIYVCIPYRPFDSIKWNHKTITTPTIIFKIYLFILIFACFSLLLWIELYWIDFNAIQFSSTNRIPDVLFPFSLLTLN